MIDKSMDDERKLYMQGLTIIYEHIRNTKYKCIDGFCYVLKDDMDSLLYCRDYAHKMLKKFKRI